MSEIRPRIALRTGRQNQPVRVPLGDLILDPSAYTFLESNAAAGVTTVTAKNTNGFAANHPVLFGELGNEGSEIVNTHGSTEPTSSTIALGASTVYPHSAGTPLRRLLYDQIILYTASSASGAQTTLATIGIKPDGAEAVYADTTTTTGVYFARFKNSINGHDSSTSDAAPVGGYTRSTVRSAIDRALGMINKTTSDVLTDEFAFAEIDNCQMEILREKKRWSFMHNFDSVIGSATTNGWSVTLPSDIDDTNTYKSVLGVRVGTDPSMTYVDKTKWDELTENVAYTTLSTTILVGATTVGLTDSGDFADSGTIDVEGGESYSYTSNSRTANQLGIASATTQSSIGLTVFQYASKGMPRYWTTWGGNLYHTPINDSNHDGRNYTMDYYKALTQITSDADTLVIPDPNIVQYYLAWKFLLKLQNGEETNSSKAMYDNYVVRREKLKQKEVIGRTFVLKPRFNDFARQMRRFGDDEDKRTRLANYRDI